MSAPNTPRREQQSNYILPAGQVLNHATEEKHNACPPQSLSATRF